MTDDLAIRRSEVTLPPARTIRMPAALIYGCLVNTLARAVAEELSLRVSPVFELPVWNEQERRFTFSSTCITFTIWITLQITRYLTQTVVGN